MKPKDRDKRLEEYKTFLQGRVWIDRNGERFSFDDCEYVWDTYEGHEYVHCTKHGHGRSWNDEDERQET